MKNYSIIFAALILLIGCDQEDINERNTRIDPELIAELNAMAIDTLVIESNRLVLDAYLWRDFMPISPPNGQPMISINWLEDVDSTGIPEHIDLLEQYVIYNNSIWISEYENEPRPSLPEYKIEKISRLGPKWGPKIYVDVISKVHDYNTNKDYYIKIENIYVERTD